MPPTSKGKQAWKRADDDGSSGDDQGVSSPSAGKQARKTADVDGSSITPVAGRRSQVSSCFPTSMASTSKQHRAWKSADADDGTREAADAEGLAEEAAGPADDAQGDSDDEVEVMEVVCVSEDEHESEGNSD